MKFCKYLFWGLLFCILFISCTSEEPVSNYECVGNLPVVTLHTSGGTNTRTTIDRMGMVKWSTTDKINVNGQVSTATKILDNGAVAEFTVLAESPYHALYPSKMIRFFDTENNLFTIELPIEQHYKGGNTFDDAVNPSVAYGTNEELSFLNLCGILKVSLSSIDGTSIEGISKISLISADQPVAGLAKANTQTGTMAMMDTYGVKTLKMAFDTPMTISADSPLDVLWVLPPATYTGAKIQLLRADGSVIKEFADLARFSVARSKITSLKPTDPIIKTSADVLFTADGGGTVSNAGGTMAIDTEVSSVANGPDDLLFVGWYANDQKITNQTAGSGAWLDDTGKVLTTICKTDITYTAKWAKGYLIKGAIWAPADLVRVNGKIVFDKDQKKLTSLIGAGWSGEEASSDKLCASIDEPGKWRTPSTSEAAAVNELGKIDSDSKMRWISVNTPQGDMVLANNRDEIHDGVVISRLVSTSTTIGWHMSANFAVTFFNPLYWTWDENSKYRLFRIRCVYAQ